MGWAGVISENVGVGRGGVGKKVVGNLVGLNVLISKCGLED